MAIQIAQRGTPVDMREVFALVLLISAISLWVFDGVMLAHVLS